LNHTLPVDLDAFGIFGILSSTWSEFDVCRKSARNLLDESGSIILNQMEDKLWYLKNSSLFEQLDAAEIATIESRSRMQKFARKGLVYLPSDQGDSVFLLTSGRIKLFHVTAEGKETVLAFMEPGELFGELALFMPGQQREEFAEAMSASTVVMIPGSEIRRLMELKPSLTIEITRLMGLRRQRVERRLKSLLFRSNRDRLVYLLLELAEKYGERVPEGLQLGIRLSHQELASVIGSTRETVTVLLGELQYERTLIVKRRRVILTNLDQLVNSLDEVPPEVARLATSVGTKSPPSQ
jgi:CRP/FNR family transcriptional regulator, cyclic AMP receptor protein